MSIRNLKRMRKELKRQGLEFQHVTKHIKEAQSELLAKLEKEGVLRYQSDINNFNLKLKEKRKEYKTKFGVTQGFQCAKPAVRISQG